MFKKAVKRSRKTINNYPFEAGLDSNNEPNETKAIIRIGSGQIISLSDLKICKNSMYRKAKFNCFVSSNESENCENFHCFKSLHKIVFSTKFISQEEMNEIYLGSTLFDVNVCLIGNTHFVSSFKKLEFNNCLTDSSINMDFKSNMMQDRFDKLPKEIRELYQYCSKSNYSFLHSLAYVFANNISKSGSFFRLKMGLMISLVAQNEELKNNCSLLAVCDDDLMISRLFQWCSSLAKKHFMYSSCLHTLAGNSILFSSGQPEYSLSQSDHDHWHTFVHSGTLNLAADGIHVFSSAVNLNSLSAREKSHLEHTLETNEIIAKDLKATNLNLVENQLKAIIWATVPITKDISCKKNENNIFKQFNKELSKTKWADMFAMVWVIKDAGLYLPDERTLLYEDWKTYFDICSSINPIVMPEAEYIVKSYFLLNRQYRNTNQFNTKSISIVLLISKCVAKLNLRNLVTKSDVILAIMLFEEQLLALYPTNMTPINFPFQDFSHMTEESGQSISLFVDDSYMNSFEQTLMDLLVNKKNKWDRIISTDSTQ